jgi:hypothetical protein
LVLPTGYGGTSFWSGGPRASSSNGIHGTAPGVGGSASYATSGLGSGGKGGPGIVLVVPVA